MSDGITEAYKKLSLEKEIAMEERRIYWMEINLELAKKALERLRKDK